MDKSCTISDSSDWLSTPLAPLSAVESGLRCQVCKDFYQTPVITSCSHTFCSLCIRRCLTSDGKCPSCRTPDQELRLRKNWAVEELVNAFQAARPSILKLSEEVEGLKAGGSNVGAHGNKRKFSDTDLDDRDGGSERVTRSRNKRSPDFTQDTGDGVHADTATGQRDSARENLPACPICGEEMKLEEVFSHLDVHQGGESTKSPRMMAHSSTNKDNSHSATLKPPDRLPTLSYSILNDKDLRKRIGALEIPSSGTRLMLIRRHQEWVNLVNANCDSTRPRSQKELLRDLALWEKSQNQASNGAGGQSGGGSAVVRKDFDGAAWAASHSDDFQQLIAKARQKVKGPEQEHDKGNKSAAEAANAFGLNSEGSKPPDISGQESASAMNSLSHRTYIDLDSDEAESIKPSSKVDPYS